MRAAAARVGVTFAAQTARQQAKCIDQSRFAAARSKPNPPDLAVEPSDTDDCPLKRPCRQSPSVNDNLETALNPSLSELSARISEALKELQSQKSVEIPEEKSNSDREISDAEEVVFKRRVSPYEDVRRLTNDMPMRHEYRGPEIQYEQLKHRANRYENPSYGNLEVYIGAERAQERTPLKKAPGYQESSGTQYQQSSGYVEENPGRKETYQRPRVYSERQQKQGDHEHQPNQGGQGPQYQIPSINQGYGVEQQNYKENRVSYGVKPDQSYTNSKNEDHYERNPTSSKNHPNCEAARQGKTRGPQVVRIHVESSKDNPREICDSKPIQQERNRVQKKPQKYQAKPEDNSNRDKGKICRRRQQKKNPIPNSEPGQVQNATLSVFDNGKKIYAKGGQVHYRVPVEETGLSYNNATTQPVSEPAYTPNGNRSLLEDDLVLKISIDKGEEVERNLQKDSDEEKIEITVKDVEGGDNVKIIVIEDSTKVGTSDYHQDSWTGGGNNDSNDESDSDIMCEKAGPTSDPVNAGYDISDDGDSDADDVDDVGHIATLANPDAVPWCDDEEDDGNDDGVDNIGNDRLHYDNDSDVRDDVQDYVDDANNGGEANIEKHHRKIVCRKPKRRRIISHHHHIHHRVEN